MSKSPHRQRVPLLPNPAFLTPISPLPPLRVARGVLPLPPPRLRGLRGARHSREGHPKPCAGERVQVQVQGLSGGGVRGGCRVRGGEWEADVRGAQQGEGGGAYEDGGGEDGSGS